MSPKISIVVPFHNEEGNVPEMYARLHSVMEQTGETYELIFVDDGSKDGHLSLAPPNRRI